MASNTGLNPNSQFFHEDRFAPLGTAVSQLITLCGAGAIGANLAETLARMGFERLRAVDRDKIEARNLSTQPYARTEVGFPKAKMLANNLYRAAQTRVESLVAELNSENAARMLSGSDLVVDCFDNSAARGAVSRTCLDGALPCLHVGFSPDGLFASGLWEPGYRVPTFEPEDPCDYPLTRPLMLIAVGLAARSVVAYLREGRRIEFEFTLLDARVSLREVEG